MSQLQAFSNSPVKASSIIGTNVVNTKGDSLGEVKEVVIDPRSGKVRAIIVNAGNANAFTGKLGDKAVEESTRAVAQALGCPRNEVFMLQPSSHGLRSAPRTPSPKENPRIRSCSCAVIPSDSARKCRVTSRRFLAGMNCQRTPPPAVGCNWPSGFPIQRIRSPRA